jgi:conjugal transfer ATP-binding protein TraC
MPEQKSKTKTGNKTAQPSRDDAKIPDWLKKAQSLAKHEEKAGEKVEDTKTSEGVAEVEETGKKQADISDLIKESPVKKVESPPGMIETSEEEKVTQKEKAEKSPVEKEKIKEKVEKSPVVMEAEKKDLKEEAKKVESSKNAFMASLGKIQSALNKGKTAGIPTSEKEKKVEAAKEKPKQVSKTKVDAKERQELMEAEKIYQSGLATIRDLIAPSSMEIRYDSIRVEGMYAQSFYVYAYPRYLDSNWLSPVINFDVTMDISQFIYPIDSSKIMKILKKKVTEMQSSVRINTEKGMVSDPALETALQDAEELRIQIQRGEEKFFQFALYFTVYSDDEKKISRVAKHLESMLGGKLVLTKRADLQMEQAFNSTLPMCLDELEIATNMNTSPLSSTFPFSSADLTSNEGILYGLNRHNDSLIIFDRFSLENANSVVFAKAGAGKSYSVKLEILRSMMMGTDVIVIDPENEYEALSETVGGAYLRVSLTSERRINPFDLPTPIEEEDVQPGDLVRANIINLHGLLKIMLGGVTPEEEAMLDKALIDVYAVKGITMEVVDPSKFPPPTMEDLYDILSSTEGADSLTKRLQKYTVGTYAGIFNKPTNIDLKSGLMVFCIRDLEDALRPIAMYIILNYIWAKVRSRLKKRILVIDEAWTMMQHEDSARFLFGLVKRSRKYYLGITTITQDVEDFIKSPFGKPVVTNSSLQLLLKQSPAAIDILGKIFNLTEGEKYMLINSGVGQGLFFAGLKHVAIQIIASYTEDKIITTNPEEILRARESAVEYETAEEIPAGDEDTVAEEEVVSEVAEDEVVEEKKFDKESVGEEIAEEVAKKEPIGEEEEVKANENDFEKSEE